MTYSEALSFSFDDISSEMFDIYKISTDSGLFNETLLPNRSIIEEKIPFRTEPYFFGFQYEPAEIPLSFYFDGGWDDDKISRVVQWLVTDSYKPLIFDTDESRIFYCAYVGDVKLLHAGLQQGYVNLTMRCNSPFSYTPVYAPKVNCTGTTSFNFSNIGHLPSYPTIIIEKIGDGDVSIVNTSDGGTESKIVQLLDKEIVTIDCENEEVETSLANTYRFNNFNGEYMRLVTGINRLTITGDANTTFKYQSKRYI